jgi:RNA polymerase sigma-70 factor (family 1)
LGGKQTYSDEQLLALLKESDQQAFEQIYSRYWKKLFALAHHKLKSRQDAEDIVHDIFASIWMRRSELHIQSLEAYLATAVKYKILEYFNKSIHQSLPAAEETLADMATVLPSDQLDHQFLSRLVEEKIHLLPEKCRFVFEQSRIAGKSNPEIARELNISRKTVEKHISNALRQLRLSLKEFFSGIFSF